MTTKQRYDRSDIRRMNASSVLRKLHEQGAMSRARIAASLGLTRATVSNIVADLIEASLVVETEYDAGGAGRPGLLLRINPDFGSMMAVDIDLDRVIVLLTNVGGTELWRREVPLRVADGARQSLEGIAGEVEAALEESRRRNLPCVGIGVAWAGLVNREEGRLVYGPTSGWEQISLKSAWEERFDLPVFLENEAHAGALGAHHGGGRRSSDDLIYLSLGVGLAAGVIIRGSLIRGQLGYAGQVGHAAFNENGVQCSCGKRGCWVTEIGAVALARKLEKRGVEWAGQSGSHLDFIESVEQRAASGEEAVIEVLAEIGGQLGQGLARLVQVFNPSEIIIGGRMAALMQQVEPRILEALSENTLEFLADPLELSFSQSAEDSLKGCLATVFTRILKNAGSSVGLSG